MRTSDKELYKKIRIQGYRLTKARAKILETLGGSGKCLTADEIYLAIKAAKNNVGMATIYRAVDSLAKAGVIRKLSHVKGRASFELINKRALAHHHHLVCRSCQRVIDYSDFIEEEVALLKKLERIVSKNHRFVIEDHTLSFTGLCNECSTRFS